MNYQTIKTMAAENGYRVADLLALAPKNDPFYTGRPAEITRAEWFAELWHQFGYGTGVHLRRMHYQIVSQQPRVRRADGQEYLNTDRDWEYLNEASKWARYLNLVSPDAFVDRRNPDAKIFTNWTDPGGIFYEDPTPSYQVASWFDPDVSLPALPALDDLPGIDLDPHLIPAGYESIEQPIHLEIWVEKTTMNDVLEPLCRKYHVNLITGAGEMSITSVVDFLERVTAAARPARILYISDYDPAGLGMPISVARKIEYFVRNEGFDSLLDIRLEPIALTSAQVDEYNLPRVPVKSTDKRKAKFEQYHGKGQVELDAMEALHPGTLARIVQEHISLYYDDTLYSRAMDVRSDLADTLDTETTDALQPYLPDKEAIEQAYENLVDDWREIQKQFDDLTDPLYEQIEQIEGEFRKLLKTAITIHSEMVDALESVDLDATTAYPLPIANIEDPDGLLYQSKRPYEDQLYAYKSARYNLQDGE